MLKYCPSSVKFFLIGMSAKVWRFLFCKFSTAFKSDNGLSTEQRHYTIDFKLKNNDFTYLQVADAGILGSNTVNVVTISQGTVAAIGILSALLSIALTLVLIFTVNEFHLKRKRRADKVELKSNASDCTDDNISISSEIMTDLANTSG